MPVISRRHGVIVVHGQGNQRPGVTLAEGMNAITDFLDESGAENVQRHFTLANGHGRGRLDVTSPDGKTESFRFIEAYWADRFPPAAPGDVALWILKRGPRELGKMLSSWWRDPANDIRDDRERSAFPANRFVSGLFFVELAIVSAVIALVYILSWPLRIALYGLYSLAGAAGLAPFGFLARLARSLHKLDPFFAGTLGDTWRFIEDGAWSTRMRAAVEDALIELLQDDELSDITILAHSEGCALSYDALAAGAVGDVVEGLAAVPRITLVTMGSGINRNFGLSVHGRGPYQRRLAERPLDRRITGVGTTPPGAPALRDRFFWLDIYARFDYVPSGAVLPEVLAAAGIDAVQVKTRKVINEDSLPGDHGAYFANRELVLPRLVRAIYGGEYPWDATRPTEQRIRRRNSLVLWLQAIRLGIGGLAFGLIAFVALGEGPREALQDFLSAILTLGNAEVPQSVTTLTAAAGILLAAPALYKAIRDLTNAQ